MKFYGIALFLGFNAVLYVCSYDGAAQGKTPLAVESVKVTILSTMLADAGIGEWGFAALVEADGRRILFDTGARPNTVIENARSLGIKLAGIRDVILSHNHGDHTGGLLTLRRELAKEAPDTLSRAHVGRGIFWPRALQPGWEAMSEVKETYEKLGGSFVEYSSPVEILGGVWITGPVPRTWPERNYGRTGQVRSPEGAVEDNIPEDQSLVINTKKGIVVISGCGHAGMINTLQYARKIVREAPVHAALGGFHLFQASEDHLAWTGSKLREMGLENFVGAHCTGIEAVFRLRSLTGLGRKTAVVGAVGASFTLEKGIDPLNLAR